MVERRLRHAFSTGPTQRVEPVPQDALNPLFYAAIEATEEAIVNALLAAETMTGRGGATVHALPHDFFADAEERYGRSSTTVRTVLTLLWR